MRWPKRKDAWPGSGAPRLRWLLLLCASLLVALAGAGCTTSSTPVYVTATPCGPPTPVGGTGTCAPLVITTDRAVYAPVDAIHVTISNLLQSGNEPASLILTGVRGCPLARVERLEGSEWEDVPVCLTPAGVGQAGSASTAGARQITLPQGQSFDEVIAAGNGPADPVHRQPFPSGLYQLVVHYTLVASRDITSVTLDGEIGGDNFILYSQPFRVCTGGVCP